MNHEALLALVAELYANLGNANTRIRELEAALGEKASDRPAES